MSTYKGYLIKPYKLSPSLLKVEVEGQGGKVPNVLAGLFTSVGLAQQYIDAYIDTKQSKVTKNGEATNQTGG